MKYHVAILIMHFKYKVFQLVKKIPPGEFRTYKEIGKKAARAVGNILKFSPEDIPCHRVIRSDYLVGGYNGKLNLDWLKAALLLREGAIGVIPTDTIYGICTSAFNKRAVEKIYALRKRNRKKPFIILIGDISDLKKFDIVLNFKEKKLLSKIWPSGVSIVLENKSKKFYYLHRGTNTLAFRLPKAKLINKILSVSGPIVAPSANWEGYPYSKTISEAKKYFGEKVFYLDRGKIVSKASSLISVSKGKIKVLRIGKDFKKLKTLLK
jgi:L-threonylcarbamoyladenylate synthase